MGKIESITVGLSSEQLTLLREAVSSGQYESPDDLIAEALEEWHLHRVHITKPPADRLGALWDAGKASGAAVPVDMAELRAEARRRSGIGR